MVIGAERVYSKRVVQAADEDEHVDHKDYCQSESPKKPRPFDSAWSGDRKVQSAGNDQQQRAQQSIRADHRPLFAPRIAASLVATTSASFDFAPAALLGIKLEVAGVAHRDLWDALEIGHDELGE